MSVGKKAAVAVVVVAVGVAAAYFAFMANREVYIPIVSKGSQHQFWQAVRAGAEQAAKDLNVKITFEDPESETMVDEQTAMLKNALANKPAAIALAALNSKAATPLLVDAHYKKIPVIAFDSGVDSVIPRTTATTDNVAAAGLAAEKMAELIGKSGEVAVVVHDETSRTGIDRRDGFVKRMKAYPDIKIVSIQYGNGDQVKSAEITKAILEAHPEVKGIFGANEGSAIGVLNAAKEMQRQIVIIGFDSGKQQKAAVASGEMAGAISQNPVGMGYKTVEAAVKAIKGETLPKVIDTGFYWYDKNNMNEPKIAAVLYD
ncbi:MAG: ABC transporter substrate-binding protein [Propionivibrio sp.]|nr:ABC transporter substrate-binding protein [Propionivibrio sp.]